MNRDLDCLLLHVPKPRHSLRPLGATRFINFMPMGLVSLCNHVRDSGFSCELMHLGMSPAGEADAALANLLRQRAPAVVGLSLYWHHQADAVIRVARQVRELAPGCTLVLGGATASYFAEEILANHEFVDAIVRGEGELPLVSLLSELAAGRGLGRAVPNLALRGQALDARPSWAATSEELTRYRFADLTALHDHPAYAAQPMYRPADPGLRRALEGRESRKLFIAALGRGCSYNCAFCGGGARATDILSGRNRIARRDPGRVAEEVNESRRFGFDGLFTDFDDPGDPAHMIDLVETIGRGAGRPHWRMNLWTVPPRELVRAFARSTGAGSTLYISPDTGSESLRAGLGGAAYSNADLERLAAEAARYSVPLFVFFAYGLPGESEATLARNETLIRRLTRVHPSVRCVGHPLELDPASPMFLDPDRFGIEPTWRTFEDYRRHHATGRFAMGYRLAGISQRELIERRCEQACAIHPRWGRAVCSGLRRARHTPGGTAAVAAGVRLAGPWHARWIRTGHS